MAAGQGLAYLLLLFYGVIATVTILFLDGTGDSGDSVLHYLFARYAPLHPHLFFDHWAKPLFVLLACPFAQFGIVGIKIFNALVVLLTMLFTYRSAVLLSLKNPVLVIVIMMFAPLYYILTFSGLTEPLFALFVALGVYFALKQRYLSAAMLISFMPYVRSEGLIIIGVFVVFFLYKKQYRVLPFLIFGSLAYAIAGFWVYGDLLWVFNKIPYARLSSIYGSGSPFHFVMQLMYVLGVPLYALLWAGLLVLLWEVVAHKKLGDAHLLVLSGFVAFFIAHSLFWYFGIFNSMGLMRVFIAIMPLMAIMILKAFNSMVECVNIIKNRAGFYLGFGVLVYVCIFPFTPNPAAINWRKDMMRSEDQRQAEKVAEYLKTSGDNKHPVIYAYMYLSELTTSDHFDETKHLHYSSAAYAGMKSGQLLIWDSWFMVTEFLIPREQLDADTSLTVLYEVKNESNGKTHFVVYRKKQSN